MNVTEELEREEAKPKKKLRAPGGLLTDVEDGEGIAPPNQCVSFDYTNADFAAFFLNVKMSHEVLKNCRSELPAVFHSYPIYDL